MKWMKNFWQNEQGQDLVEYTLLLAFVALASAGILISMGTSISTIWSTGSCQMSKAASASS